MSSSQTTDQMKENLSDAGAHLKSAASALGDAVKNAASAAGEEMKLGHQKLKSELSDTAHAGRAAAGYGSILAKEQADALTQKGRDLLDNAVDLIRQRPLAAFGSAFAAGWLIAKIVRGNDK